MGATVTTRLTVHDFVRLPEEQTQRAELVDGEVVPLGNAGSRHEKVKSRVLRLLFRHTDTRSTVEVLAETMFDLRPDQSRMPDVSVLLDEPSRRPEPDEHYRGAPDVAVEIVSSESATDLQRKIHAFLNHGGKEVWVLYPEIREMYLYTDANVRRFSAGDQIASPCLPGFDVKVGEFFE